MAHPSTKNGLALVIMALSMFLLSVGDVTVRYIGATVPAGQLIAIRGVILIMILMLMMRVMRDPFHLAYITNRWALIRGCSELISTYCFFISIQLIPIAVSTTIVFIFPVLLTLASIPLFGEKVGGFRLGAVAMGFLGVIIIAAPSGEAFNLAMIYPLVTAVGLVVRDLATRQINDDISSVSIILTTAIVTSIDLSRQGKISIVAVVAPFLWLREEFKARAHVKEVYVHTTEPRGREHFHSDEYGIPEADYLDLDTTDLSVEEAVERVRHYADL